MSKLCHVFLKPVGYKSSYQYEMWCDSDFAEYAGRNVAGISIVHAGDDKYLIAVSPRYNVKDVVIDLTSCAEAYYYGNKSKN